MNESHKNGIEQKKQDTKNTYYMLSILWSTRISKVQLMALGKLNSHIQNNEVGLLPHTIYTNELKMYQWPKYKS